MAVTATPIFAQTIVNGTQTILPADTTTVKAVLAAGTNGTKVEMLAVTSTDTTARDLGIYLTISATSYLIGTVSIPITAGFTNAIVTVDILRSTQLPFLPFDAMGNRCLYLASGTTLSVGTLTTVTTAKQITITCMGANF
jgi:hypothetical protein